MLSDTIFRNNELQFKFKWVKMEKIKQIEKMKKVRYLIVIILANLILINAFVTYSSCNLRLYALATTAAEATTTTGTAGTTTTKFNDTAALFLMINFERMRTQLMLVEQSLPVDKDLAFLHAYVIHSVIFPSIENILEKTTPTAFW